MANQFGTPESAYIDQKTGKMTGHPNNPSDYIIVRIKKGREKGKLAALSRKKDFSPHYHEKVDLETEAQKVEPTPAPASETPATDDQARFEELKAERAWLKTDLKDEYNALKEKLNG
jgi:hypothetical protein